MSTNLNGVEPVSTAVLFSTLSNEFANVEKLLCQEGLDQQKKVEQLPFLESLPNRIANLELNLETRLHLIKDAPSESPVEAYEQSSLLERLTQVGAIKEKWKELYCSCQTAHLDLINKTYKENKPPRIQVKGSSLDHLKERRENLKKINYELMFLQADVHLSPEQQKLVEKMQSKVKKALTKTEQKEQKRQIEVLCPDDKKSKGLLSFLKKSLFSTSHAKKPPTDLEAQNNNNNNSEDISALLRDLFTLPDDILYRILPFLSAEDLASFGSTNSYFNELCNKDDWWEQLLHAEYPKAVVTENHTAKQDYITEYVTEHLEKCINECFKKGIFNRKKLADAEGPFHHFQKVGNFLIGCENAAIKVFDLKEKTTNFMIEHRDTIRCLQIQGDFLFSGSKDATIKIWNWRTGEYLGALLGHKSTVNCLLIQGDILFSGSDDKSIKIWNWKEQTLINDFINHAYPISHFEIAGDILIAGSQADGKIYLWNWKDSTHVKTLNFWSDVLKGAPITCLHRVGNDLLVGTTTSLNIWDLSTWQYVGQFTSNGLCSFTSKGHFLFAGHEDGSIEIFDLRIFYCTKQLSRVATLTSEKKEGRILVFKEIIHKMEMSGNIFTVVNQSGEITTWDFNPKPK
jgi:hypothetical protein